MATKEKRKGLLSGGLFDKPFMDSRATTHSVSTKEWVLGHLIGPLGLIFVVNTIAALVEKFFTQQTGAMYGVGNVEMIRQMGGWYEIIIDEATNQIVLKTYAEVEDFIDLFDERFTRSDITDTEYDTDVKTIAKPGYCGKRGALPPYLRCFAGTAMGW